MTIKALLATNNNDVTSADVVYFDQTRLMPSNVPVAVEYSTVNYRDGMTRPGFAPIIRTFPLIAALDFSERQSSGAHRRRFERVPLKSGGRGSKQRP